MSRSMVRCMKLYSEKQFVVKIYIPLSYYKLHQRCIYQNSPNCNAFCLKIPGGAPPPPPPHSQNVWGFIPHYTHLRLSALPSQQLAAPLLFISSLVLVHNIGIRIGEELVYVLVRTIVMETLSGNSDCLHF